MNDKQYWSRTSTVARAALVIGAVVMAGCASKPSGTPVGTAVETPAPAVQSLQQYLDEAKRAATEGNNKERARELYRTAARVYPASKEPWLKLAEDYFETANYGQAILAAQEVTQRDPQDSVASSVLAVSGLRVSAAALSSMQSQNTKLAGGTRSEAQNVAKVLREALGETELVPQATGGAASSAAAKPPARTRAVPPARRAAAAATPAAPGTPAATPGAQGAPADPFKILQK